MSRFFSRAICGVVVMLASIAAEADVGPPVHMQITETEPEVFAVQWRVPTALPPRAAPSPVLPERCRLIDEVAVTAQPAAWLIEGEWRCEGGLASQVVGMDYPYGDLALTTVIRVDLLSGDRFAHVLSPGDPPWQLPQGTAARDLLSEARRDLVVGATHALRSWLHIVFAVLLSVVGGPRPAVRLVTAFSVGQVGGVAVSMAGLGVHEVVGELALAAALAVVARQALVPPDDRRPLTIVIVVAGLFHGLGLASLVNTALGSETVGFVGRLLAVLGIDAAHLVSVLVLVGLWDLVGRTRSIARLRRAVVLGAGGTVVALALALVIGGSAVSGDGPSGPVIPSGPATGGSASNEGSRRLAPAAPDAPLQSFISIEPYEVRHEAMVRLGRFADELGLGDATTLDVADQPAVTERLASLIVDGTALVADGVELEGVVRRVDFMSVDATGALPRPNAVPEAVDAAIVGVVVVYPTVGIPEDVVFRWPTVPAAAGAVPVTVIDPENVAASLVTDRSFEVRWENSLREDPIPAVEAVAVEPTYLPVPLLSLPLLGLAGVLVTAAVRGRRPQLSMVASRIVLALAVLVGPLLQIAVAVPGSAGRTPTERQARRILSGLLPNIYRALEFRDEALIYDRLAISVAGDALTEVYLEQRRALEVEERGGAQARVEAVEVLEAGNIRSLDDGFEVRSVWTVGGMVTHFGHRHFRQNRYDALIDVVPVEGNWKIDGIDVLEQDRLK